jgi:hypothetical protein
MTHKEIIDRAWESDEIMMKYCKFLSRKKKVPIANLDLPDKPDKAFEKWLTGKPYEDKRLS